MRPARSRRSRSSEGGGLLKLVVTVAVLAWIVRSLLFAPFSIPSGSMLPTLYIGDYLFVAKWPYGYSKYSFPFRFPPISGRIFQDLPERGEVVVFVPPGDESEDYVKRVIGLPGDTVEMRQGRLFLNGHAVERSHFGPVPIAVSPNSPCRTVVGVKPAVRTSDGRSECLYPGYRETLPNGVSYTVLDQARNGFADNFPATKVPAGRVFLMGDNRDDSLDSRFSVAEGGIGLVPLDHLAGRASLIFWSTDGSSSYVRPWTWFTALRAGRIGRGFESVK